MRLPRPILGVVLPLGGAFVLAWLLGAGTLVLGGNLNPLVALGLDVVLGVVGGYLLRSWWAVALVPGAVLVGVALAGLIRTGTLVEGEPVPIQGWPLYVIVFGALLVPSAVGALIGAVISMRSVSKPG